MKTIKTMMLVTFLFGTLSPAFSAESCMKDRAAREVIQVLDRYAIQPEMIAADIENARQRLNERKSYCGDNLDLLDAYGLCTGLALIDWDFYTRGSARARQELNRALAKFAQQFPSSIESPNTFNCDLKLRFQ